MENPGEWLNKALSELCGRVMTGLDLNGDMIPDLVSYCDLAPPQDAKEFLDNIIGEEAGRSVTEEYLRRRGYSANPSSSSAPAPVVPVSEMQAYIKPRSDEGFSAGVKKAPKGQKEASASSNQSGNQGGSRKKKGGKVVSLAEAAKGSIVFQQGKPCSCQARRHKLVSNCLSCGKIVCEQEGEGPCNFCGALVLKEGSTYAGLEQSSFVPLSEAETAAEAYAKRLVDYDRNSAARTTVIDDQSDYYDEGNTWMSPTEKELLKKKEEDMKEAEKAARSKVVIALDLVGRKVVVQEDEYKKMVSDNNILLPSDDREVNRIKPNPSLQVQPIFINPSPGENSDKEKRMEKRLSSGLCLTISGRVQHDTNESRRLSVQDLPVSSSSSAHWQQSSSSRNSHMEDEAECAAY